MNEAKSSRYQRGRRRAAAASLCSPPLIAALVLAAGLSPRLRDAAGSAAGYAALLLVLRELIVFPMARHAHALERQYGLTRVSTAAWLRDYLKGAALSVGGAAILAGLGYLAIAASPRWWWLGASAVVWVTVAMGMSLGPLLAGPAWRRARALPSGPLHDRLTALARRTGIAALDVRVWRAGEGSGRAGAAHVGIGGTRRVLVSSTLVEDFTPEEVEAVVAHEIAHHVHHDQAASLCAECTVLTAGFAAAAATLTYAWPRFGWSGPADPAGLPLLMLMISAVPLTARPLLNALSRRNERRADRFAIDAVSPDALIGALRRMAGRNLVEERPPRTALWMFHAHPSVDERIASARELSAARTPAEGRAAAAARASTPERESCSPVEPAGV